MDYLVIKAIIGYSLYYQQFWKLIIRKNMVN